MSFRNPEMKYRSLPFYAWNGRPEKDELRRQCGIFEEMGFGGAVPHARVGLETPYLSDEFMDAVRFCAECCGERGMYLGLYDEDRWPSGYGGGFVTRNRKFSRRWLLFTRKPRREDAVFEDGIQTGGTRLLRAYRLAMDGNRLADRNYSHEKGLRFYAYQCVEAPSSRYDGAAYVNVLDKEAVDEFLRVTYDRYAEAVGGAADGVIRFIFTDEPQLKAARIPKDVRRDAVTAWTDDFEDSYLAAYGESLLDRLPELFFDFADGSLSEARYRYHRLKTERFVAAYSRNIADWCHAHGFLCAGHMCDERTLAGQTHSNGEAMAHYACFDLPGFDILSDTHEYTTAKQVSSVAAQLGKPDVICELYGAASIDSDFSRFKEEGDWLRALGVSLRVPHLALYSYKGEGKRDYPPSFNYQNAWHGKLRLLEDHFARQNEALAGTRELVRVGVIHPIESYWLTLDGALDRSFQTLCRELLFRHISFDFLSESLLEADPSLAERYGVLVVPEVRRLRESTEAVLAAFSARRPVFHLDPRNPEKLFADLAPFRLFEVDSDEYLGTLRADDRGRRYLFLARPAREDACFRNDMTPRRADITVTVPGNAAPALLDTLSGETRPVEYRQGDGVTRIRLSGFDHDSFLLSLDEGLRSAGRTEEGPCDETADTPLPIAPTARFSLREDNVLLLDRCAAGVRGLRLPQAFLLRQTDRLRRLLGLGPYDPNLQPWLHTESAAEPVELFFRVRSAFGTDAFFVTEHELERLTVNGREASAGPTGFYLDRCLKKYPIRLKKGSNLIRAVIPFGAYSRLENCFLTGRFGVYGSRRFRVAPLPERVSYGSLTGQGFPFYSGVFTYLTDFDAPGGFVSAGFRYRAALLGVRVAGQNSDSRRPAGQENDGRGSGEKTVWGAPYTADLPTVPGPAVLETDCYISQENAFGPVHVRDRFRKTDAPRLYYCRKSAQFTARYGLRPTGLAEPPRLTGGRS